MTTEEIYNQIIEEKESGNYPELDELNSTSNASVWRTWVFVFAYFSKIISDLFDEFKAYIESIFARNQHGTLLWWIDQIKAFQFGDTLEFIDGIYKYALIDNEKQVIKQVALDAVDRLLTFKVASDDGNGNLIPLTPEQVSSLDAYVNKVKFPGTFTSILSQSADTLRLTYRIYYNAEVVQVDLEQKIRYAVDNYLSNLVFNGKFTITGLTDEIQKLNGVIDPVYVSGIAKNAYESDAEYQAIEDYYIAAAGYISIDTLTLEFIADV